MGWQHGPTPEPPDDLTAAGVAAWETWFGSWFAAHWTPEDLPGLRIAIGLYDQVADYLREPLVEKEYVTSKGDTRTVWVPKPNPAPELRQWMDNYGITLKGQQDRRWVRGEAGPDAKAAEPERKPTKPEAQQTAAAPYRHLSVVAGGKA